MAKLKPLQKFINSPRQRCCAMCGGTLTSNVLVRSGGLRAKSPKVQIRDFRCDECTAYYCYERSGSQFEITDFSYKLDTNYEIICKYDFNVGFTIVYDPDPNDRRAENIQIATCDRIVPFPSTKEKLEQRIEMYVTFS